jgi:molybdopterin synthase catalytic subunit
MIDVRVQPEPFELAAESARLIAGRTDIGAVASFVGLVRGESEADALTLEHYPAMTQRALRNIADEAARRWPLHGITVIHRVGRLAPGEPIVLVLTAAAHRGEAFAACEFVMDYLKTCAPFWKKEEVAGEARWIEARAEDESAAARWRR